MKTAKRMGIILSLIVLCVTLMAVSAFAATTVDSGTCGDNLTWTLDDTGTLTISGTGDMEDYTYWPGAPWEDFGSDTERIVISEGVTSIGTYAFPSCWHTTSVTIPGSVTKIGEDAFGEYFEGCKNVYYTGNRKDWEEIDIEDGNDFFDYILIRCKDGIIEVGGTCRENLTWFLDSEGTLTISGTGDMEDWYMSTETPWSHNRDSIVKVIINNGVTSIGDSSFADYSNLTSVTIPDGVTRIGWSAFYGCSSLTTITFPAGLTNINYSAFEGCDNLTDIFFEGSRDECNFMYQFENVTWHFKWIADGTCGENVTWIIDNDGTLTISGTGDMEDYYKDYAPWYSYRTTIKKVVVSEGVTSIGDYAFYVCSNLTSATIPESVTSIDDCAFWGCDSIEDVYYLGSKLDWEKIDIEDGNYIFNYILIRCKDGVIEIGGACGDNLTWTLDDTDTLTISGTGDMENYSYDYWFGADVPWAYFEEDIKKVVILDGVTSIGNYAFWGCSSLTSVTIPEGVTSIGNSAFRDCGTLSSVAIPNSVTSIGNNAFAACSSLTCISVSENNINYCDISGVLCNKEKTELIQVPGGLSGEYSIPEGVTSIGNSAFEGCESLTSVTIPEGVTSIGNYAFSACSSLTSVTISDSVTNIGHGAFYDCSSLTSVTIPDSVTEIRWDAFRSCISLTSVTIPDSVTSIYDDAFYNCISLKDVYYTGGKADWAKIDIDSDNGYLTGATIHYNYVIKNATPKITKLENTASGIKITWKAVSGAEKYRVYIKNGSGWKNIGTTTGTSLTYTGAKSGTAYTFTVRCLTADGSAYTSDYNTKGWTQTYVAQPAISKLENTASGVKLTWNKVSGAGQYRIFVKTSKGWTAIGTTSGTTLTYTGAKSGTKYTFTIRALDKSGKNYVSSYNTTGWKQTYVAQPSISKLENTASGIKLTWKKVTGAGQYRIFVKTSKGWTAIGTTSGTTLTYTGAKSGTAYTFTIRAMDKNGKSYVSSYNTTGWKQTYVAQPSISKLSNTSSGIKLTWNKVSGAGMYRVYVKTSSGWTAIGTTSGTSLTWKGAKKGVKYTFTIRAMDKNGKSYLSSYNTTGWSIKRSK